MGTYADVLNLCKTKFNWDAEPSAAPGKNGVATALKTKTPEVIAKELTIYASKFPDPPEGYEYQTEGGKWAYKLFYAFGGGTHFRETNTNIALGLAEPDAPLPKVAPAFTAEDAWEIALQGWYYTGDTRFLDLTTEAGRAELDRRLEFAKILPLSWDGVDHNLYKYFVICNLVPSEPVPFGVRVSELATNNYGFTVQKWLDNQWAIRKMLPTPWGAGGVKQG